MIDTIRQSQVIAPMTASVAILRCVPWVYFHILSTSLFRFVRQTVKEDAPSSVRDTFSQTMVPHHIEDHQILNTYDSKFVDYLATLLMSKVFSLPGYPLMKASYYF